MNFHFGIFSQPFAFQDFESFKFENFMNQRRFEQSSNTSAGVHLAKLLRVMKEIPAMISILIEILFAFHRKLSNTNSMLKNCRLLLITVRVQIPLCGCARTGEN